MRPVRPFARRGASIVRRLARDRRAGTAIEYGLILALITIAMLASFNLVASATIGMWGNVQSKVSNATGY